MNSLCFLFAFSHVAAREVRFTERAHTCGSHCISTGRGGLLLFPPPPHQAWPAEALEAPCPYRGLRLTVGSGLS